MARLSASGSNLADTHKKAGHCPAFYFSQATALLLRYLYQRLSCMALRKSMTG
jgi:hypothetical protein